MNSGIFYMAGPKGFEPSVFSVTGRRVNRATPRTHAVEHDESIVMERRKLFNSVRICVPVTFVPGTNVTGTGDVLVPGTIVSGTS